MFTKEGTLKILKEIKSGKDGQELPFDIIKRSIVPIKESGCLDAVIYLLERMED